MHLRRVVPLVVALFIAGTSSAVLAQSSGPDAVKPSEPAAKKPPAATPAAAAKDGDAKTAAGDAAPDKGTPAKKAEPKPAAKKDGEAKKKPDVKPGKAEEEEEEDDDDEEEYEDEEPPPGMSKAHLYQLGLAVRAGTGYKTVAPYSEGQHCGEVNENGKDKRVCGDRQPVWLEISPSFGITKSLEILIDVRLTLEDDFADTKGFYISPGIKYYATPHGVFKFFASGQLVFDYQDMEESTKLKDVGLASFDFGIRSALGIQFDVHKNFGFYLQGGISVRTPGSFPRASTEVATRDTRLMKMTAVII